jgi:zinc-binding alcohol dehydrogenase family protein
MRTYAYVHDAESGKQIIRETEASIPVPGARDLLVEIEAVSINPVDLKVRANRTGADQTPLVAGWDAAGKVLAVGADAHGFQVGDRVMYAGDITRAGSYATHQLVDHRVVAQAPAELDAATAASIPLTALTAWEALHDHFRVGETPGQADGRNLLVINGAGGVGSFAIQLAKRAGLHVTATASRAQSADWCRALGANDVLAHNALLDLPDDQFDLILCCHDTDRYFGLMARLVAPFGHVCLLSGAKEKHDIQPLMAKSAAIHWEFMFTRTKYATKDMARQGEIIGAVAGLVAAGVLRSTLTKTLQPLSADTLEEAQKLLGSGGAIGKVVVAAR